MIPAPLRRVAAWWAGMSGPDKFRLYTRLVLQSAVISVVAMLAVTGIRPLPVIATVIVGLAAIAAVESQPELSMRADARQRRLAWRFAVICQALVFGAAVVIALAAGDGPVRNGAAVTAFLTLLMASGSVLPFVRHPWPILIAGSVLIMLLMRDADTALRLLIVFPIGVLLMWTTRATVWSLHVLSELEESRDMAAELQVAEERLRIARDLHDAVGRGFSAIAVKSELAATLVRAGAADRAATEMDEVKSLAVTSMEEMRSLVRGYRDVDLAGEVAGARSLLAAAGCRLTVTGSPDDVPTRFHETAAWVVREGTTNIVKHSTASAAELTLRADGLELRNDGAPDAPSGAPSGLAGLAERVHTVGAQLRTTGEAGDFVLAVTWEER
ncbi:histidine kinase [Nocardiopsis tropica]